ncbi:MAG TPA: hypothetical protein VGP72_31185 [Planctomycetota bacterium]
MWELERYDWAKLRSATSAKDVPTSIMWLKNADSAENAEKAYWRIDNEVVVQGSLYEAALPTATCLVLALQDCTESARPRIIELLVQLGSGEASPIEIAAGNAELKRLCMVELCRGASAYFAATEIAAADWVYLCVDVLSICVDVDQGLKPRVAWYFNRLLSRNVHPDVRRLIEDCLSKS